MAEFEITIDSKLIQDLFLNDRGIEELAEVVLNQVLESEMTEHLQADRYEHTDGRQGQRNGHYTRKMTSRVGTLNLRVPRDRDGSFSTAMFGRLQRNEKALVLALMEMVLNGVSTRRVQNITDELCGHRFKKSTVSDLCKGLNEQVEAWCERPLADEYPFVLVDAMHIKVRRQGAVRSTGALIIIGINSMGYRAILGVRIADSECETSWKETFRWLKKRGAHGVEYAVSDAHQGLVDAVHECFQGAVWQRCQTHFRRNLSDHTTKGHQDALHEGLDRIFKAADRRGQTSLQRAGGRARRQGRQGHRDTGAGLRKRHGRARFAREVPAQATHEQHDRAPHRRR